MRPAPEPVGGIIDDVTEALHWRPILAMLHKAETAPDLPARAEAFREIAAFVLRQFKKEPGREFWYLVGVKLTQLLRDDPEVRSIVEKIANPSK